MSESTSTPEVEVTDEDARKRRFRAMPTGAERDWKAKVASVFVHGLVLLLLILPSLKPSFLDIEETGAGGAGPAGGGGGGSRGTGGVKEERLQYIKPTVTPQIVPPVVPPPVIPPIVKKEEVVPPPVVTPPVEAAKSVDSTHKVTEATSVATGTGGGSGNDGTAGNGPGTGGGKGSGVGTGTGSSVGAGTGGGFGTVYPPTVTQLVLLPIPAPSKDKKYELEAIFDVDSLGNASLINWTKPKDSNYAEKVLNTLKGYKFRPAVRADGTPTRGTAVIRVSVGK